MFSVTSVNTHYCGITVLVTYSFMHEAVSKHLNKADIDRKYRCILRLPGNEKSIRYGSLLHCKDDFTDTRWSRSRL